MRLDVAAVDLGGLGDPALLGQGGEDAAPHAAPAPPVPAVVDRRRRAVIRRAVLPATAALEHMHDPRDHPPVIHPPRARLVLRQMRLNRRPRRIRQPEQRSRHAQSLPQIGDSLNQHIGTESSCLLGLDPSARFTRSSNQAFGISQNFLDAFQHGVLRRSFCNHRRLSVSNGSRTRRSSPFPDRLKTTGIFS